MLKNIKKSLVVFAIGFTALTLQGCSPEIGSKEWCADMKEKPKGEWTANEAKEFTKNCLL
jgi:hypothetical protein